MTSLHPQLQDVLALLAAVPGLVVEPMQVNSAISSRSDVDAIEAAHIAATWAADPTWHQRQAGRLLLLVYRDMARKAAQDEATTKAPTSGGKRKGRSHDFLGLVEQEAS